MWGMWQPNVPKMKLRVYQFDRILRYVLPDLHTHFQEIELTPEILVAQWYERCSLSCCFDISSIESSPSYTHHSLSVTQSTANLSQSITI